MTDDAHTGLGPQCQVCPVCALLRTVRGSQPEVVEHLAVAARELVLALRAAVDAHVDGHGPATDARAATERDQGDERLQRIRID